VKLVRGNGREVTVRDVGPVLMTIRSRPDGPPIKVNGWQVLEDDDARHLVRHLLQSGHYDNVKVDSG
jgi:hypothetical protein